MAKPKGVLGEQREVAPGVIGEFVNVNKKGEPIRNKAGQQMTVFRIVSSTPAAAEKARMARSNPRPISQDEAKAAFEKYYARTRTIKRGPRKGLPRFKSPRGRRAARTYDLNHTSPGKDGKRMVKDARYLHNPNRYEYEGVDTGSKVRKPLTQKQQDVLARGQAALKRKYPFPGLREGTQAGGYWW